MAGQLKPKIGAVIVNDAVHPPVAVQFMHLASALRNAADALEAVGAAISTESRTPRAVMRDALPDEVDSRRSTDRPNLPPPQVQPYPPLSQEVRATVGTGAAAFHLNRQEQTLRVWACYENGPLRPRRMNGRLAWAVADIRRVLGAAP